MRSIAWSIAGTWQPSPELSLSPFLTPTCFTCGYMVYTGSSCGWLVRIGMKNGREQEDGRRKKKEGRNYRICSGGWGGPGVWTGEIEKRMCPLVVYFAGLVESFSMLLETGRMCVCVCEASGSISIRALLSLDPFFLHVLSSFPRSSSSSSSWLASAAHWSFTEQTGGSFPFLFSFGDSRPFPPPAVDCCHCVMLHSLWYCTERDR
jgi:hypothetical protein